jgi:hypothetical protein
VESIERRDGGLLLFVNTDAPTGRAGFAYFPPGVPLPPRTIYGAYYYYPLTGRWCTVRDKY